jgi:hypothetical protein
MTTTSSWLVWSGAAVLGAVIATAVAGCSDGAPPATPEAGGVDPARIQALCTNCHNLPPPDALPRKRWREVLEDMWLIIAENDVDPGTLERDDVIAYFEARAPVKLDMGERPSTEVGGGLEWERSSYAAAPGAPPTPATSHLSWVKLFDPERLDLLLTDMRHGFVMALRPYQDEPRMIQLGVAGNPVHAEVTDLDADGKPDIVVADLGSFDREDHDKGRVVWLRPQGRRWELVELATGLGRVCDARPADLDGDGDLDLAVAEFGWRATGRVLWLQNHGLDPATRTPRFELGELDLRHGAIHVPCVDLDGDGLPEVVGLISQQHECIVVYRHIGTDRFECRTIYQAPHPAWGSSGLEMVDLDGDGDLDILYTNGDTLDDYELKPYQAIWWLENLGDLEFEAHELASYHGVNRALAADLDGDGDQDVIASAFLPHLPEYTWRRPLALSGVIWLEQTEPGSFERRTIEPYRVDHPSLAVADYDGDGDVDIAVGNFSMLLGEWDRLPYWVTIWEQR